MICYFLLSRGISCFQSGNYGKITERKRRRFEVKTDVFCSFCPVIPERELRKARRASSGENPAPLFEVKGAEQNGTAAPVFRKFSVIRGGLEVRRLRLFEVRDLRAPAPGKAERWRTFRAFYRRRQVQNGRNVAGEYVPDGCGLRCKKYGGAGFSR